MARQWMKFFLDAGISKDTSAEYALEFESNRMEMSLLGDLDKDCLRDLNVTAIGDILKILRHAKSMTSPKSKEKSEIKEELTAIVPKEVKKETPTKERTVRPPSIEEIDSKSRRIVSSRLGPPKSEPVKQEDAPSSKSPSVFRRLGSQPLSEDETSPNKNIFERLGPDSELLRHDSSQERESPQEARVSSTSSDGGSVTPGKGILKRRGTGSGSVMSRSISAPNIVSLKQKSQESTRRNKTKRLSFGPDEVRYMEPSPGIKSRLGFGRCSSPPAPELDEIDEPGLQTELKKIAVGKDKFELKRMMKIVNESNKALRMSVTPERSVGDDSQEFYVQSRSSVSESKDSSLKINIKNNEYRKSQDTEYHVDKVDLALRAAKLKSNLDQRREESSSSKLLKTTSSRKRLVKIETLDDGSKVRSYIEPNDPILEAVPVKRSKKDSPDKKIKISAGHVVPNFTVDRSSISSSGLHSGNGHRTLAQKAEYARSKQETSETRVRSDERSRSRSDGGEVRSGQVKSSSSVHHRIGSSREQETEGHRDRVSFGSVRDRMGSREERKSGGSIRDRLGGKEESSSRHHDEKNIYSRLGDRERD